MSLATLQAFDRDECIAQVARIERRDAEHAADRRRAGQAVADERRLADRRTESSN